MTGFLSDIRSRNAQGNVGTHVPADLPFRTDYLISRSQHDVLLKAKIRGKAVRLP